ncbi:helix-turn-helix domain-containing protein [Photobacterium kishitanii]|uniref:helix-turn-helix domain-containing protein n=1 Tax=Photobacterium kishitanii TaxID=318456 RepID=UPI000D1593D9|nr:helix-turn-helix domain-containing protein [Photobacterium kishitanii]PSV25673.1 transcriptional regulator [Photobacterium kishitanii]
MTNNQDQLKRFSYSGGKSYIAKLKSVLNETTDVGLARRLGIPKGTISTWMQRDTTPFEVSIIVHLATGLSLRWLLLDEGKPFETNSADNSRLAKFSQEKLQNGVLVEDNCNFNFDMTLLERYSIDIQSTKIIENDAELLFINIQETNPASGRYLIDIDGSISLNHLQRLPGKKLAMSFGDSSIEISESDIVVLGRVALAICKE